MTLKEQGLTLGFGCSFQRWSWIKTCLKKLTCWDLDKNMGETFMDSTGTRIFLGLTQMWMKCGSTMQPNHHDLHIQIWWLLPQVTPVMETQNQLLSINSSKNLLSEEWSTCKCRVTAGPNSCMEVIKSFVMISNARIPKSSKVPAASLPHLWLTNLNEGVRNNLSWQVPLPAKLVKALLWWHPWRHSSFGSSCWLKSECQFKVPVI